LETWISFCHLLHGYLGQVLAPVTQGVHRDAGGKIQKAVTETILNVSPLSLFQDQEFLGVILGEGGIEGDGKLSFSRFFSLAVS
jgi:hypothetical protein